MQKLSGLFLVIMILTVGYFTYTRISQNPTSSLRNEPRQEADEGGSEQKTHTLSIESLRSGEYPGSDIIIEQTLDPGINYNRYIVSYKSEGLKIYALLTIPQDMKPSTGWPVIIFNHGYIPPSEYRTTERYIAYTDAFSQNGYILLRPDYRGHGNSEGQATGAYGSNAYTIDILNAVASIKKLKDTSGNKELIADSDRVGMWGHSMGGHVTLRNMVVNKDIKAGVIWAGVVASYRDLINNWRRRPSLSPFPPGNMARGWRQTLIAQYGDPEKNPEFWDSLSANSYLKNLSGPLQLHHGTADTSVPVIFSEKLAEQMKVAGKEVELYIYPEDNHNMSNYFNTAIQRSVEFFDKHLK